MTKARGAIVEALQVLEASSTFFAGHLAKRADQIVSVYTRILQDLPDNAIIEAAYQLVEEENEFTPHNLKTVALQVQETDRRLKLGKLALAQDAEEIPIDERITEQQRKAMLAKIRSIAGGDQS